MRNRSLISLIAIMFLFRACLATACAEEDNPVLGRVTGTWGKRVVKIKFDDPSAVKKNDVYFLYRDNKVVGKVQVYEPGRDTTLTNLVDDTGPAAEGDLVKKEGKLASAAPIDLETYEKLTYPIFEKTCGYAYIFFTALNNLEVTIYNKNDPESLNKFKIAASSPGSEGWLFYIRQFQKTFVEPATHRALVEGDDFFTESIDQLKAVSPPDALKDTHTRLLGLLAQLRVLFTGFKQVPEGSSSNDYNYIVGLHNKYFAASGDLTKYTLGVQKILTQVIEDYFEFFPEWKEKDPRSQYKKNI